MKLAPLFALVISLTGCNDSPGALFGPTIEQVAGQCGVSVPDLKKIKSAVNSMQPYAGVEAGKCSVIKDDSGVVVIPPEEVRRAKITIREERQAILNGMADRCRLPRSSWKLISESQVTLELAPGTNYEKTDCLLSELRKSKLPLNLGFVGREHYQENSQ